MVNRWSFGLGCWMLSGVLSAWGQGVDIEATRLAETNRVEVDVSGDMDLVVTLLRSDVLATTGTPVAVEIVASNSTTVVTETTTGTTPLNFYTVLGRDLATSTFDSDGDGIKDATEVQATGWLDPLDPSDAAGVDLFDVVPDVAIGPGLPAAGAGAIEASHAADLYRIPGNAGVGLFFDVTSSDASLNFHTYELIDPYGTVIATGRFVVPEMGPVALPATGEYLLRVGDLTRDGTGDYAFNITIIPAPELFVIAVGDTVAPGVPAPGAGQLEAAGAFDRYSFTASAGDAIFVDTLSFLGVGSISYRILDPDGVQLDSQRINFGDMGTVALSETGTYVLEVGEIGNSSTGTYSIAVTGIPAPDVFAIAVGDTVQENDPGPGAGHIEVPGVFDLYTFAATAGDKIFVETVSFDFSVRSVNYRILGTNDVVISEQQLNIGDMGTVELPDTGTYTLEVGEDFNNATGTYAIAITGIPPPDVFAIAVGDTVMADDPGPGAGRIEVPGAFDQYTFSATAGDRIFLDSVSFAGVATVNYRLRDVNGAVLADRQLNIGDVGTVELPDTGTYTLEVGEAGNSSTGTYAIAITAIPATDVFAIAVGDTVMADDPGPGAGHLEVPGAFDQYTFSATAGDKVFVDVVSFAGVATVNYRLRDINGAVLADKQLNFGASAVELPDTGTYTLEVGESANSATGTYTITITSVPPPDVFAILIGDTISDGVPSAGAGNIEVPGAADQYTFSANAGDEIDIDVISSSGVNSVGYRLYDPATNVLVNRGNLLDRNDVSLPTTGTYTLEVGESVNSSTGTYSIAVLASP